jgi:phosphate transport system permease protein
MFTEHEFDPFDGRRRGIAQRPSAASRWGDRLFRAAARLCTWGIVALVFLLLYEIGGSAMPAVHDYGLGFLVDRTWDTASDRFGILPQIWGTLYSSLLALMLGGFLGLSIAIFLTQGFLPPAFAVVLRNIVELLAAVPSVIYGLWGIYVVIPALRPLAEALHEHLAWVPLFSTSLSGPGMLPAALVLAIMILPTIAAVSQDALRAVPHKIVEAAYGLGTTRWEAILKVIVPTAGRSIFGAMILGLGRALGETMALAMLVGNVNQISLSLFSPANTLAALLALNFPEADQVEVQALMYAAVVLLLITLAVNLVGAAILARTNRQVGDYE